MEPDKFVLKKEDVLLLIIDIQERLAVVMNDEVKARVTANCVHLIELAKMQNIPVVVTEQYPKGLGKTVPQIQAALPAYQPVEKMAFNCCGEPSFLGEIKRYNKKKIIVAGMETHICVLQTTVGLLQEGFVPHVVNDAVCSRTKVNWNRGLEFMRDAGAVITGTETVLFQLLGAAGTDEFRVISKRIK